MKSLFGYRNLKEDFYLRNVAGTDCMKLPGVID
jgi:hypothetical protein